MFWLNDNNTINYRTYFYTVLILYLLSQILDCSLHTNTGRLFFRDIRKHSTQHVVEFINANYGIGIQRNTL